MRIEQIPYNPDAFARLAEALDGYGYSYRAEVEQGAAQLWEVDHGASYAITRIEHDDKRAAPVLVLCCYEGRNIRQFTRQMIAAAKRLGVCGIRAHASRPGMWRIGQALGFEEIERVFFYGIEK